MIEPATAPAPEKPALKVVSGGNVDTDLQAVGKAGLFITMVKYGERVTAGQLLGQVVDSRGTVVENIRSQFDGWVIVLKRRPHVKAGDQVVSVAVADSQA